MAVLSGATASGRQFYIGQPNTTTQTVYTAPALSSNVTSSVAGTSSNTASNAGSATAYIKEIVIANSTASPATITLYLVPSGGSANASTAFMTAVSVTANDTKILSGLNIMMTPGSTIQALQGTPAALMLIISGTEIQ